MYKSFFAKAVMSAFFSAAALHGAGVAVELDGRSSKIKLNAPAGLEFRYPEKFNQAGRYFLEFYSAKEPGREWKQYEVTFVPQKSGFCVLGLSAAEDRRRGTVLWIEYDKIELVNARAENLSFEEMNTKKEFFRWRYYTKQTEKRDQKDAFHGKNYVRVCNAKPIRQGIRFTAGKPVTLRFMARSGGSSEIPGEKFFSDQSAPRFRPSGKAVSLPGLPRLQLRLCSQYPSDVQLKNLSVSSNLDFTHPVINGRKDFHQAVVSSQVPLTGKWEKYTIRFTPSINGRFNMYLEAAGKYRQKAASIFVDKFESIGTKILNPSFEQVQSEIFARWKSLPVNIRKNMADAPDGKNAAAVIPGCAVSQSFTVMKGRPVTICFYARKGDVLTNTTANRRNRAVSSKFPKSYYRYCGAKVKYLPLKNKGIPGNAIRREQYSWIKLPPPPALTIQYPVSQKKGVLGKTGIPFELLEESRIARRAFVRFGFPFPQGGIYGIDKLRIVSPAGKTVPAQFTATAFWPDKSIKFVLAEFPAQLQAQEKSNWKLEVNSTRKAPEVPELKCIPQKDGFTVDTGKLTAQVSKKHFNFLNNIQINGQKAGSFSPRGLEFVDEQGKVFGSSDVPLEKLCIESRGPLALTLRADGRLSGGRFTTRMTFHAGSSVVDFSIRFQNVNLKTEFTDFRSLSLAYTPAEPVQSIRMERTECQRICQLDDRTLKIGDRLFNRMMHGSGAAGNITYALRDAAYRYPKAFSVEKGSVKFELLPPLPDKEFGKHLPYYLQFPFCEGLYRIKWGMSFTEELKIDFSGKTSPAELAAKSVIPVIDTGWLYKTKVFQGIPRSNKNPFAKIDEECIKAFRRHMKFKAKQREYGFLNWGDWFGERGRNWTNNEYDFAHGMFMLYLRTGDRDVFRWAQTAARHQADVDIIHAYPDPMYVGANAQHAVGHTGQSHAVPSTWSTPFTRHFLGSSGHTWSEGMTEAWLLGGDAVAMESALLLGEHLVNFIAPTLTALGHHERSAGWSITALLGLYRATGKKRYLDAARLLVELALDEQNFEMGGAWAHQLPIDHANGHKDAFGNCPYLIGILTSALQRYYREVPDPAVKRSIISAAKWLHRSLDPNRIGWAYGTSWDNQLLWPANQNLNLLTAPGMTAGGQLADDPGIFNSARKILFCAMMTGLNPVGKELSLRTCVLPQLYEELNTYCTRHPEAAGNGDLFHDFPDGFKAGTSDSFQMRGPDNMAFDVLTTKPEEITILRKTTGANPFAKPEFNCRVTGEKGNIISSFSGSIRTAGKWKIKLPAAGQYKVEIMDSGTGAWDVLARHCRIRTELRKGYMFVNQGVSRQNIIIPAGKTAFTLEFFGTHEGRCCAFLFDPRGKLAGSGQIMTSGQLRLPWFKNAETRPKGRIRVKLAHPFRKESLWKLVIFCGGSVRMDLIGTNGWVER
ncbi:MAG: hypothetical protein IKC65_08460 [Lentisphaeria bacterium]|nr:hypothetical protein [Lentisphaeria bacterium]